jgi:hypothetical protein
VTNIIFTLVIQSTLTMIYINFSAIVVDDENFGIGGTFVTGGKSDKLLIRFEHNALRYRSQGESRSREDSNG